jgi:protein ImuB
MENSKSKISNSIPHQRIACLWFPNWPIQRLVVARPELRCQQVVLFRQDPRRGRLVAAASPLAMQAGVRVGMPLSEAKSLLQRASREKTDSFFVLEHDPNADLSALNQLADSLSPFSPLVGVEQIDSISNQNVASFLSNQNVASSILLDITGLDRLFGGEEQLASELLQFVHALDYLPRLAIANTVGAAWGASRFGTSRTISRRASTPSSEPISRRALAPGSEPPSDPSNVPVASAFRLIDPDTCLIIPPDDNETFLSLPIESLRLPPPIIDLLHQLGVRFNEQLWRLPRAELAMRFGDTIHRRIDQATGKLAEPMIARHAVTEFAAEQLLEYPTNHRETIEVIISRLVEQLCQQLRARQQGGMQWLVTLLLVDEPAIRLTVNLFQASATASEIMSLVEMQLEQQFVSKPSNQVYTPPRRDVSLISEANKTEPAKRDDQTRPSIRSHRCQIQVQEIRVAVTSAVLLVPHQRMLFDEGSQLNRQALTQLINRLTSRLGPQQVVYPQLLAGAQPEYSYRYRPLVDIHRRRRAVGKSVPQSHVVGRPLRIFHPAIEIETETGEVQLPHSMWKCKNGEEFTITQAIGPERIETGWWRGPTVCRDYWRVETDTGQSLWLYRDLRQKRWFLQGEF